MRLRTTCKETTELASRAMDEALPFSARVALRLHLAVCKNCARFAHQLHEMRRQFRQETAADDDAPRLPQGARERIVEELQKKLGS
ncbi:MAG: zf-HC2 domain-containing protein [Gammaproteobacteria bacterium]